MAATFASLRNDIRRRSLKPLYVLHGAEGYYIDRLTEDFIGVVDEADRDFNLYQLYGSQQLDPAVVEETCRRYPMMSDRQVVILKEAQSMRADQLDRLARYAADPAPTTVFVICFRGSEPKGKKLMAEAKAHGEIFESKKLSEKAVMPAIAELVKERGLAIEPKGLTMLRDYIGADLAKLYGEIDKLAMILPKGATVTPEAIERNIGISKDYNNYELIDAIASRNVRKAFDIVDYFKANPKNNPTVMVVSAMFSLFANLLVYHFTRDKSQQSLMAALGLRSPWQLRNYETAARSYNAYRTIEVISAIRRFDAFSKGVGSRQNEYDMLRDLVYHIFTAPGDISF